MKDLVQIIEAIDIDAKRWQIEHDTFDEDQRKEAALSFPTDPPRIPRKQLN